MIEIVPYRDSWPGEFRIEGSRIARALGGLALAIHHIGSTSVPGLDAKDILDIQVTVADLEAPVGGSLERLGFAPNPGIRGDHRPAGMGLPADQLEKRLYGKADRAVNLHVRVEGRFNQRYPLLCRDYLRTHPLAANAYAEIKRQLARRFADDADACYAVKDPVFDVLMAGAYEWAEVTGWNPPASDVPPGPG